MTTMENTKKQVYTDWMGENVPACIRRFITVDSAWDYSR